MKSSLIKLLNRRLGDSLGCIDTMQPRFAWKFAPDQPYFVYASDNRTLLKKTWADAPAPDGGQIGPVWLLAEWRKSNTVDNHGFGEGIRMPFIRTWDYAPYFETALAPGMVPTEALTQKYIHDLRRQMEKTYADFLAEEAYTTQRNDIRDRNENREAAMKIYDDNVGAFGNCEPGKRHGYMSFQNDESRAAAAE